MKDMLPDAESGTETLGNTTSMSSTGNKNMKNRRPRRSKTWRHIGQRKVRAMKKLDQAKVEWIIREKRNGMHNKEIAKTQKIFVRWVQKLWKKYKNKDMIVFPAPMGRPKGCIPGRREHSAVLSAVSRKAHGAVSLERSLVETVGIYIPHNTIHKILRDAGIAEKQPKKSQRRKWIRYERTYSNSMWHTDYKQMDDGRWFLCYEDDASRFVTGFGVFQEATTENALAVLDEAIKKYGKPASILTDHDSQFYANESEAKKKGVSRFEERMVELDIKHILARVKHPLRQTASWKGFMGSCNAGFDTLRPNP